MATDFSTEIFPERSGATFFKHWMKKSYQPKILYIEDISFKNKDKINRKKKKENQQNNIKYTKNDV